MLGILGMIRAGSRLLCQPGATILRPLGGPRGSQAGDRGSILVGLRGLQCPVPSRLPHGMVLAEPAPPAGSGPSRARFSFL